MVEHPETVHKAELIAEIERARMQLGQSLKGLRHEADIKAHFQHSFSTHKAVWLGGAGIAGWVLSRLPARKKKVKVFLDKKDDHKIKEVAETGLLIGILKFAFTLFKPAILAFATRKFTDLATRNHPSQN